MTDNEIRATGSMPLLDWFLSLFVNKYKRRIEVARWKANIRLVEIDKELLSANFEEFIKLKENKLNLLSKILLLDQILKGREVKF